MAGKLRAGLGLGAAFGVALALPLALAMPKYREQAIRQFHYSGSLLSRKTLACTFCHVNDAGGAPWNVFGEELRAGFRVSPGAKFDVVLYDVLAANHDADGDGYADALEVFAKTLPGDSASKPAKSVQAVAEQFEAAGGVGQYAPK